LTTIFIFQLNILICIQYAYYIIHTSTLFNRNDIHSTLRYWYIFEVGYIKTQFLCTFVALLSVGIHSSRPIIIPMRYFCTMGGPSTCWIVCNFWFLSVFFHTWRKFLCYMHRVGSNVIQLDEPFVCRFCIARKFSDTDWSVIFWLWVIYFLLPFCLHLQLCFLLPISRYLEWLLSPISFHTFRKPFFQT